MNPHIDTRVPARPNRGPLHGLTPEEAAGLIFVGVLLAIGAVIGSIVTWCVGRWG